MTKAIVHGSRGRMGETVMRCGRQGKDLEIIGGVDIGDALAEVIDASDVVIDFSFHDATLPAARLCKEKAKALVIGTTGHSETERAEITALGRHVPMVWASNYSTGVNALFWLTRKAAEILGEDFDVEILEMHHRTKKDAPSGTATTLGEVVADALRRSYQEAVRHGREGLTGERTRQEIGMHSLRGGDVVGDHTVIFAGSGERLELTHRAASRETFAHGALRAAAWVAQQGPGIYTMQQVLGLDPHSAQP